MIEIFEFSDNDLKKIDDISIINLNKNKYWIDIYDMSFEDKNLIGEFFNLHTLTLEDLFNPHARIKVEEFENYMLCVFYGIIQNSSFELSEIDFVIGKNFIMTNHKLNADSINKLKKNNLVLKGLFKKGVSFIFHRILDLEVDSYFEVLEELGDKLEGLDEEVLKNPKPKSLSKLIKLKREIINIKKFTLPQREKISFLAKQEYKFIVKSALPYFRDIYDHAIRVSDMVDNYREMIYGTFDVYMGAVSNNTNEVMKTLSIIATIALPLTVISSIYGTNFFNLPGSKTFYGFWIMILGMVILSILMIFYFRKKKWL